jgi:hypothetical protein
LHLPSGLQSNRADLLGVNEILTNLRKFGNKIKKQPGAMCLARADLNGLTFATLFLGELLG